MYVDDEAEGESDQGGEAAREGHGITGVSNCDVYRADQEVDRSLEEEQER